RLVTGVRVEGLSVTAGRAHGLRTTHGEVASDAVVLAVNAWTPWLVPALTANITPIREHVCVTEPLPPIMRAGFETNRCNEYWRQMRSGEIVVGGYAIADAGMGIGTYSMATQPSIPPLLADLLGRLFPSTADARIVRCWAGLLDFASLELPAVGPLPAADGGRIGRAYVACGLTGHGMPYAPVLGLLLAETVAGRPATSLPLDPFDPARYVGPAFPPTWLEPFGVTA
ncbi:MAG: FAD-binding oxidoreductase, partial [Chloroflexota bacterium]|nr:FAD-binding oxidoreductase [Chloroflexota bacterium]